MIFSAPILGVKNESVFLILNCRYSLNSTGPALPVQYGTSAEMPYGSLRRSWCLGFHRCTGSDLWMEWVVTFPQSHLFTGMGQWSSAGACEATAGCLARPHWKPTEEKRNYLSGMSRATIFSCFKRERNSGLLTVLWGFNGDLYTWARAHVQWNRDMDQDCHSTKSFLVLQQWF